MSPSSFLIKEQENLLVRVKDHKKEIELHESSIKSIQVRLDNISELLTTQNSYYIITKNGKIPVNNDYLAEPKDADLSAEDHNVVAELLRNVHGTFHIDTAFVSKAAEVIQKMYTSNILPEIVKGLDRRFYRFLWSGFPKMFSFIGGNDIEDLDALKKEIGLFDETLASALDLLSTIGVDMYLKAFKVRHPEIFRHLY